MGKPRFERPRWQHR